MPANLEAAIAAFVTYYNYRHYHIVPACLWGTFYEGFVLKSAKPRLQTLR